MKVILKQYVYKHGVAGDIVDVADGFARNYLLPTGRAVKATERAIKENQSLMAESAIRRNELNDQLVRVAQQIDGVHLVFGRKAAANGNKLYGSVTTTDIAAKLLEQTGIDINRRRISDRGLRELGNYDIPVRMGTDNSPVLKVTIVREEELVNYLAALNGTPAEAAGEATSDAAAVPADEAATSEAAEA